MAMTTNRRWFKPVTTRCGRIQGFLCVAVACTLSWFAITNIDVITSKPSILQCVSEESLDNLTSSSKYWENKGYYSQRNSTQELSNVYFGSTYPKQNPRKDSLSKHNVSLRVMPKINMGQGEWENLKLLERLNTIENATLEVSRDTKVILWYIPTRHLPVMSRLHRMRNCPQSNCRVTTNRAFYNQSDALIFTAQLINAVPVPPPKLPNQVWILQNHESPHYWAQKFSLYNKVWESKFNWTVDYRDDADIISPYGHFRTDSDGRFKRGIPPRKNYSDILSAKNGSVAWMVSSCEVMSKRMKYVKELRKHGIQVDIFGGCGTKHCHRADDEACLGEISKKYKFYLAFENAFCKDYITEKFFRYFTADILLIVRGGGDYSKVAPAQTYINTADYASPKELAAYINKLENNEEEYIKHLQIKDPYEVVYETWPIVQKGSIFYMEYHDDAGPMCELCDRLWNADRHRKLYNDIATWFKKGLCYEPKDLPSTTNIHRT